MLNVIVGAVAKIRSFVPPKRDVLACATWRYNIAFIRFYKYINIIISR
jgi:hypothetical protein